MKTKMTNALKAGLLIECLALASYSGAGFAAVLTVPVSDKGEGSILYENYIVQGIGDVDTVAGEVGPRTYEDVDTPQIQRQGWTHFSKWYRYELKDRAKVSFHLYGDPADPQYAASAPAMTIWSGDIINNPLGDIGEMKFSELHAFLPDPKIGNPDPTFDPNSWPRDAQGNYIFFPYYVASSIGVMKNIPQDEWALRRTNMEWVGTYPNTPDNPQKDRLIEMVLDPGVYTLNLANHFDPDRKITVLGPSSQPRLVMEISASPAPVPVPAAFWLFAPALCWLRGLCTTRRADKQRA